MEAGITTKLAVGTGTTAAVAAPAGLGYAYRDEISSYFNKKEPENNELKTLNDKLILLGLPGGCKFSSIVNPVNCEIKTNEINSVKFVEKGSDSISTDAPVTLKIEKINETANYPNGLKFTFTATKEIKVGMSEPKRTILSAGSDNVFKMNSGGNQLEKIIKTPALKTSTTLDTLNTTIKSLGLPDGCKLTAENSPKTCQLNKDQIKVVKFVNNDSNNASATQDIQLKVEKVTDSKFPENLKFSFTNVKEDVKSGEKIILKKGTNPEFKIKTEGAAKKLEKAWSVAEIADKVGLTCNNTTPKQCEYKNAGKINLWVDENSKFTEKAVADQSKKFKYEEDAENYNQGFKFISGSEITISGETSLKIEANKGYEVSLKTDGKWYLSKKD